MFFVGLLLAWFADAGLVLSPAPFLTELGSGCQYPFQWKSATLPYLGVYEFFTQPGTFTPITLSDQPQALLIESPDYPTDWMTVKSGFDNSTMAHGQQPLYSWGAKTKVYIHWSLEQSCSGGLGGLFNFRKVRITSLGLTCVNSRQFPALPTPIDPYKGIVTIAGNNFAGDYSVVTGAVPGHTLKITSSQPRDYLTVHMNSWDGPVIAYGGLGDSTANTITLPSTLRNPSSLYLHWNLESCTEDESERTTTIQDLSGGTRAPTPPPTRYPTDAVRLPAESVGTVQPSKAPTTGIPTKTPTGSPSTTRPTGVPTKKPTRGPTVKPTRRPTRQPTMRPSKVPTTPKPTSTFKPSRRPTSPTTLKPTRRPTNQPTRKPTKSPSERPTTRPTTPRPTTSKPTPQPTMTPTSRAPTRVPTRSPVNRAQTVTLPAATNQPTVAPTQKRTRQPTQFPTRSPVTRSPTTVTPTGPTRAPTTPTRRPTSPTARPTQLV